MKLTKPQLKEMVRKVVKTKLNEMYGHNIDALATHLLAILEKMDIPVEIWPSVLSRAEKMAVGKLDNIMDTK